MCRRAVQQLPSQVGLVSIFRGRGGAGWGGRDRTSEWRNQNPLPYRLATPQQAGTREGSIRSIASGNARSIEGVAPFQQAGQPNSIQNQALFRDPKIKLMSPGCPGAVFIPREAQYRHPRVETTPVSWEDGSG